MGAILAVVAYAVFADSNVQRVLTVAQREVPLYTFLLLFLGIFLILSGLLILSKETRNHEELATSG